MAETASQSLSLEEAAESDRSLRAAWVLAWAACWLLPFAVFHYALIPNGYGMFGASWVSGLFFLLASAGGAIAFRDRLPVSLVEARPGRWPIVALVASATVISCGNDHFILLQKPFPIFVKSIHRNISLNFLQHIG